MTRAAAGRQPGLRVALLRGVNVGGRNRLPMEALAAIFRDAGCRSVSTFIQSGNVLFEADEPLARRAPALIEQAIADRFGFGTPVVTRTAAELAGVVKQNPFLREGADTRALHVAFLKDRPDRRRVASLEPDRSPPDRFVVRGREIYLHLPNGTGRSRLTTQYFDSRLWTVATVRNWNTVVALRDLARQGRGGEEAP